MTWTLDADRPIYAQLVDRIRIQIVSGQYPPGSRLPSVRELAAQASVNPNTMQRAFGELERSGLVVTQRTFGRTVTEDGERIGQARRDLARAYLQEYFDRMGSLGYSREEIRQILKGEAGEDRGEREGGDT